MAKKPKSRSVTRNYRTARRYLSYVSNPRLSVLTSTILPIPSFSDLFSPRRIYKSLRRGISPNVNRNRGPATDMELTRAYGDPFPMRARVCQARAERREVLFAAGRTGRGSARGPRRPKSEVKC